MRFGAVIPYATEREFTELAAVAEAAGWDMVFSWEAVWGQDAWVTLGAAAMATERIRLGTLLTPAARHRPWDLASRVASVDRLSNGRVTLGVGLGALHGNWLAFEPDEGRAVRARKLDEGLAIYAGLMGGQPFEFTRASTTARRPVTELVPPPPVQQPAPAGVVRRDARARAPAGSARSSGPRAGRASSRRSPGAPSTTPGRASPPTACARSSTASARCAPTPGLTMEGYDVVVEGDSHGDFGSVRPPVQQWADAGATWWVESWWDLPDSPEGRAETRRRLELGPRR